MKLSEALKRAKLRARQALRGGASVYRRSPDAMSPVISSSLGGALVTPLPRDEEHDEDPRDWAWPNADGPGDDEPLTEDES